MSECSLLVSQVTFSDFDALHNHFFCSNESFTTRRKKSWRKNIFTLCTEFVFSNTHTSPSGL